jgi:hypothetical protein
VLTEIGYCSPKGSKDFGGRQRELPLALSAHRRELRALEEGRTGLNDLLSEDLIRGVSNGSISPIIPASIVAIIHTRPGLVPRGRL